MDGLGPRLAPLARIPLSRPRPPALSRGPLPRAAGDASEFGDGLNFGFPKFGRSVRLPLQVIVLKRSGAVMLTPPTEMAAWPEHDDPGGSIRRGWRLRFGGTGKPSEPDAPPAADPAADPAGADLELAADPLSDDTVWEPAEDSPDWATVPPATLPAASVPPAADVPPADASAAPAPGADAATEAVAAAGLGVYDFDLVAGTAAWSERALTIFGGFDAPPTAVQLRARVHPLDWPKLYAARQEAERHSAEALADFTEADRAAGRAPDAYLTDVLHRVIRPDHEVRWVRATGEYQFGPDGAARRSVGVLRDVTEEMEERARLAAEIERRRRALAASGLGTFDYDARTEAVLWDAQTKQIFGLPEDAPDARTLAQVAELLYPDDRDHVHAAFGRAMNPEGGGRLAVGHRIVRPDGSIRRVLACGAVEFADGFSGRYPVRTVGTIEDVTDGSARPAAPAD